jgi:hypothetical protein
MAVGTVLTGVAGTLAFALLLRALDWPHSFPQFLAYFGAGFLALVGLLFAFWTYACAAMRYDVEQAALVIRWGPVAHRIPGGQILSVARGRGENTPKVAGIGWMGYHVGHGSVDHHANVLFYSTHRVPEDIVYVETPTVTYAVSPLDPGRFVSAIERAQEAGRGGNDITQVEREVLAAHPIWSDRIAQYLLLAAVAANVALWGFVLAEYPHLHNEITIEFPPVGDITTLQSRGEIFQIPATASAFLVANLLAALLFQPRERAATYLVLSGTIFFQVVFWVGAVVAVVNA